MCVSAVICAGECVLVRLYVLVSACVSAVICAGACVLVRLYVLVSVS